MSKTAVIYLRVSTKEQAQKGGEFEGFSIPAQREACRKRAVDLGANVVAEFVDAGESARSADRPELQQMLKLLGGQPVDFVIVHKIDRLARNRLDDAQIHLAIKTSGAELVSATENIDETPSGMLLHGIMSSIAEFYSRNLAHEVTKGMEQKAKTGGTPGKAPLGYRNVRVVTDDGREVRTVEVDAHRAPLITWAFVAYASGEWTLQRLAAELEHRGLLTRPTPKSPGRPIKYNSLHKILTTPYYKGEVTYRGARYPGKHQPLIDEVTWNRVQDVLSSHAMGEKQRNHPHYLKSSVYCGKCGSRLVITMAKNRYGRVYPYFICVGRHQRRLDCLQRAVPIAVVEEKIEQHYATVQLDDESRDRIEEVLMAELRLLSRDAEVATRDLTVHKDRLVNERMRLMEAHYAGAVPIDLLKTEQDRIARQLASIDERLSAAVIEFEKVADAMGAALDLAVRCHKAYLRATDSERRLFNQALFAKILVDEDTIEAELAEPFKTLSAVAAEVVSPDQNTDHREKLPGQALTDVLLMETNKPAERVAGLKMSTLVQQREHKRSTTRLLS